MIALLRCKLKSVVQAGFGGLIFIIIIYYYYYYYYYYQVYQLGTGRHTQKAKPVLGAYP